MWLPIQELKATNDTLRALQMQLEKAFHIQNSGGQTNSTLTAILETKDARIATLEKEVKLLEHELDRQRDFGPRDYVTSPFLDHPLPSHSMGYKQQVSEEESGVFHVACRAPSDTLSWPQCLVFCIRQHYLYYLTSCLCHSVCSVHIPLQLCFLLFADGLSMRGHIAWGLCLELSWGGSLFVSEIGTNLWQENRIYFSALSNSYMIQCWCGVGIINFWKA